MKLVELLKVLGASQVVALVYSQGNSLVVDTAQSVVFAYILAYGDYSSLVVTNVSVLSNGTLLVSVQ